MAPQTPPNEQIVSIFDPLPHRYMFVPGTGALATQCRARTHAIGRPVYVVHDSAGDVAGVRVPHYVIEGVIFEESLAGCEGAESSTSDRGGGSGDTGEGADSDSNWEYEAALRLCGLDGDGGGEFEWIDADGEMSVDNDDEYVPSTERGSGSGESGSESESGDEEGESEGMLDGGGEDGDEVYHDMWLVKGWE